MNTNILEIIKNKYSNKENKTMSKEEFLRKSKVLENIERIKKANRVIK